jgi:hypothetical protein
LLRKLHPWWSGVIPGEIEVRPIQTRTRCTETEQPSVTLYRNIHL